MMVRYYELSSTLAAQIELIPIPSNQKSTSVIGYLRQNFREREEHGRRKDGAGGPAALLGSQLSA
jgi:hypothetical protein